MLLVFITLYCHHIQAVFSEEDVTLTFKGAIFGRHDESDDWEPVHNQDPEATHSRRIKCTEDTEHNVSANVLSN